MGRSIWAKAFPLAALLGAICSCGPSSTIPVASQQAPAVDESTIKSLIAKIDGYSERMTDVPVVTPADAAAGELEKIGKPAVPYLLQALKSPKPWGRVHSMEILSRLHESKAVQPILEILRSDPESGVRGVAAYALGKFNDPSVLPDLRKAATSKSPEIARSAWESLGELRDAESIPVLIRNLGAETMAIPSGPINDPAPREALVEIGAASVEPLRAALPQLRGSAQHSAAFALSEIGTDPAIAVLRAALKSKSTRGAAFAGLLESKRKDIGDVALAALSNEEYVFNAEEYLKHHRDPKCLPTVRKMLLQSIRADQLGEASSHFSLLVAYGDRSCDPEMIAMLRKHPEDVSDLDVLAEARDPQAIPLFLATVSAPRTEYKQYAIQSAANGMAALGDAAIPALLDHVGKRPSSAEWAGSVLGRMRDPSSAARLIDVLNSGRPDRLRAGAAEGLGHIGGEAAKAALMLHAKDPSPLVRSACEKALGHVRD